MVSGRNKVLERMVERVHASMTAGPAINCRPHNSRQRVDLRLLERLQAGSVERILDVLLGTEGKLKISCAQRRPTDAVLASTPDVLDDTQRASRKTWEELAALISKLRNVAEDAKTFEQDTGSHALQIGFPLLYIPTGRDASKWGATKRILAPIAFIPVSMLVRTGRTAGIEIECAGEGIDRVVPNATLLAWVERQTGVKLAELFADEQGTQPWREINGLATAVSKALELAPPAELTGATVLQAIPRSDDEEQTTAAIVTAGVLGLFPLANQSILRDLEAMAAGEVVPGPVESFLRVNATLGDAPHVDPTPRVKRRFEEERLVSFADPCQSRAVRLARRAKGLVVHGPPGTGKSQTITNMIGDHLGRGERVLFVCDKRTALDVVKHRLDALGLGALCAIVHDPQRDQRDLYMGVREQLDALPEVKTDAGAPIELDAVDRELTSLHQELTQYDADLSCRPSDGDPSFHDLVGRWFSLHPRKREIALGELTEPRVAGLGAVEKTAREVLERAQKASYSTNLWRGRLGIELGAFLAQPQREWEQAAERLEEAAAAVDAHDGETLPIGSERLIEAHAAKLQALADSLEPICAEQPALVERWAKTDAATIKQVQEELAPLDSLVPMLERPGDPELTLVRVAETMPIPVLVTWMGVLLTYLQIARKWYGFLYFGRKSQARKVVQQLGLTLDAPAAERAKSFLERERARKLLRALHDEKLVPSGNAERMSDAALLTSLCDHRIVFEALLAADQLDELKAARRAFDGRCAQLLKRTATRARAIGRLEQLVAEIKLFSTAALTELATDVRAGAKASNFAQGLSGQVETIEGLLRMDAGIASVPPQLGAVLRKLADASASANDGWCMVERAVVASEIARRLRDTATLQQIDADRLQAAFDRYRQLEERKRGLVRDAAIHAWTSKQQARLLASTKTRLNGAGADLRRRLTLRGEKALRLRQVIANGAGTDGGDPLFDLRPVWMASPETVAQIFPREALFDTVIFDEASQCRLEEALPVLVRAKRLVVAGDPKQLPPTRFFESAVAQSQDLDVETDQELFEEQQADTEDLLSAALNLEMEQCHLDVHYRSRNSDLIEFSNDSFYDSRLQAIPGHPNKRAHAAPIRVIRADGVYDKRVNTIEARKVVAIVRELLAEETTPSIGIACFNLTQRAAILEALDEEAAADSVFAGQLAAARTRRSAASFEGLFVKNLENVQGDERDHMIISTTYGPDPKGKFYRRFGPLGQPGGGRRLNVLVTRAREMVHLVTSIPRAMYNMLPPVEPDKTPNGGWLLFSYLAWAEGLTALYEKISAELADRRQQGPCPVGDVAVAQTTYPSKLSIAIGERLAATSGHSSVIHWGNDGFSVDVALRHPERAEDVTIGLLCDGSRYEKAEDRVEWDLFRTLVHESQGWKLLRIWSPRFFRDPEGVMRAIRASADEMLSEEKRERSTSAQPSPATSTSLN